MSSIHAYAFRLQELRRNPKERMAEALSTYFHEEFEAIEENKELIADCLGIS